MNETLLLPIVTGRDKLLGAIGLMDSCLAGARWVSLVVGGFPFKFGVLFVFTSVVFHVLVFSS